MSKNRKPVIVLIALLLLFLGAATVVTRAGQPFSEGESVDAGDWGVQRGVWLKRYSWPAVWAGHKTYVMIRYHRADGSFASLREDLHVIPWFGESYTQFACLESTAYQNPYASRPAQEPACTAVYVEDEGWAFDESLAHLRVSAREVFDVRRIAPEMLAPPVH